MTASSHRSATDDAPLTINLSDFSSYPSVRPATVSSRTCSKAKSIILAGTPNKNLTSLYFHQVRDTKPALLNWTTSEEETNPDHENPQTAFDDEISSSASHEPYLICENMDTSMNSVKLANLQASYNPGCHLVVPSRGERYHRFDNFGPGKPSPVPYYPQPTLRSVFPCPCILFLLRS